MSIMDYIDSDIFTPVYDNKLPYVLTKNVDRICKELFYAIKSNEPIFIYGDYDMDGFCAAMVWQEVLRSLYDVPTEHFYYSHKTHLIDKSLLEQVKNSEAKIVLILDSGSSYTDRTTIHMLSNMGKKPIVIDHHTWYGDYFTDCFNYFVYNPHEEKDVLLEGGEVSGAYASLLVANVLCQKYFNKVVSFNAMVFALASMYSDVVDLSSAPGRALYNLVSTIEMPGPNVFISMNDWDYSYSRRFFSYIVSPKFNACFRTENFEALNKLLISNNKFEIKKLSEDIKLLYNSSRKLAKSFVDLFEVCRVGDVLLCLHDITETTELMHIRNYTGLIANIFAQEYECMVVVGVRYKGSNYEGSYRDFYNRKMLDTFRLFCEADGHTNAFGVKFRDSSEFRKHLEVLSKIKNYENTMSYDLLSSNLIRTSEDVQILAMYNEYMNNKPLVMINHRCTKAVLVASKKYRKIYDVGLPYNVSSSLPLITGSSIIIEPMICKKVELRCLN